MVQSEGTFSVPCRATASNRKILSEMADAAAAALAGGYEASVELAVAAQVLAMDLSIDGSEGQVDDPMLVEQAAADLQKLATDASEADKENINVERLPPKVRSGGLEPLNRQNHLDRTPFVARTDSLFGCTRTAGGRAGRQGS